MNIPEAPLLDNLAPQLNEKGNPPNPHLSYSRRNPLELSSLWAGQGKSYDDVVVLGYNVVHVRVPVGERSPMPPDFSIDALPSPPLRSNDEMADKVRGI